MCGTRDNSVSFLVQSESVHGKEGRRFRPLEHRKDLEATFWTRTVKTGEAGAPERSLEHVEQRWFVGCHANVGGPGLYSSP